jgi:hypothetical protein
VSSVSQQNLLSISFSAPTISAQPLTWNNAHIADKVDKLKERAPGARTAMWPPARRSIVAGTASRLSGQLNEPKITYKTLMPFSPDQLPLEDRY